MKEAEASQKTTEVSLKHVKIENNQDVKTLKKELLSEKKVLEVVHREIEDFEVQKEEVARKVGEAYKASQECYWEKLNFA